MAIITGIKDTLDAEVARFSQTPLAQPVLLNSVPKGGTHLLRNIVRMFVPVEQHYDRDWSGAPNGWGYTFFRSIHDEIARTRLGAAASTT